MYDIFLSYASEDRERVRPLVDHLESRGWSIWWDRQIKPGETWEDVLETALARSRSVVVVWTEAGVRSRWVRIEAAEGLNKRALVPVRLDLVEAPLAFRPTQAADLSCWNGEPDHPELGSMCAVLEELIEEGAPEPPPGDEGTEAGPGTTEAGPGTRPGAHPGKPHTAPPRPPVDPWRRYLRHATAVFVAASVAGTAYAAMTPTEGSEVLARVGPLRVAATSADGSLTATASQTGTVRLWTSDGRQLTSLEPRSRDAASLAVSPDGRHVALGSTDSTLVVRDVDTGAVTDSMPLGAPVRSAVYSPSGHWLAAGAGDGRVHVFPVSEDGALAEAEYVLHEGSSPVWTLAFSPDEKRLAAGRGNRRIHLWDLESGTIRDTLAVDENRVSDVRFSADGRKLISGSWDRTVRVFDRGPGGQPRVLAGHAGIVHSVAISPDGSRIASGGADQTIRLWDAATGTELQTLTGHTGAVRFLAFAGDGQRLVSASEDQTLRSWSLSEAMSELEGGGA